MYIVKGENGFYTSVVKSLKEIDENFEDVNGLLIVGTHTPPNGQILEEALDRIQEARAMDIPVLGICMGFQLMLIEFARNVLKLEDANSEEIEKTQNTIVEKLPELRVGIRPVTWKGKTTMQSHWHNYAFNKTFLDIYQNAGWDFSFTDGVAEIGMLKDKNFYYGVQYHPEYQSSKERPDKLLKDFLSSCRYTTGGRRA